MTIAHLTQAIETLVREKGYKFCSAAADYRPSQIAALPAAFLLPPEFRAIEGRKSGKITYRISLDLLAKGARLAPAERTKVLDKLESDIFAIFGRLSAEQRVVAVEEMTVSPVSKPLTSLGDVAMRAVAEVVTCF